MTPQELALGFQLSHAQRRKERDSRSQSLSMRGVTARFLPRRNNGFSHQRVRRTLAPSSSSFQSSEAMTYLPQEFRSLLSSAFFRSSSVFNSPFPLFVRFFLCHITILFIGFPPRPFHYMPASPKPYFFLRISPRSPLVLIPSLVFGDSPALSPSLLPATDWRE